MTFKQLVMELMKREGKRQGVNIAQMSEVVKCLGEIVAIGNNCHDIWFILHNIGAASLDTDPKRPAKRKGKKK